MFNFMKKGVGGGSSTSTDRDREDKERRKREKKERKEKQKRDRGSMSAEELLRLDEVRRSLKIRGRRKEKEKLPSGITADYTAAFLASLDRDYQPPGSPVSTISINSSTTWIRTGEGLTQSDSSEASLNSLTNNPNQRQLPPVPPRPPKRGILKGPRINVTIDSSSLNNCGIVQNGNSTDNGFNNLIRNTLQNEVITYQNVPATATNSVYSTNTTSSSTTIHINNSQATSPVIQGNGDLINGGTKNLSNNLLVITSTSPSVDSLTDTTTNSSFATPPFSLSPVGESQGFHRWTRTANFDDMNLPLPNIVPLVLPKPRTLTIQRQPAPRNDFGFSLRRAMIVERNVNDSNGVVMKAVIFAEPGAIVQNNNETGLLPGDRLLEVNGVNVDDKTREEIIDLIKSSKDSVTVKVQPVAELSELSRRSGIDGRQVELADSNIRSGTLRRSGSRRFKQTTAKSEEQIESEREWLDSERLWLVHRSGFTACQRAASHYGNAAGNGDTNLDITSTGKVSIRLDDTGEVLQVDEDDIEKANPPSLDRAEDIAHLRYLNESSVLHILRQRYASNLIHTYAGPHLIVINPMAPLAIYSEKVVAMFKGCKTEDMPPHIYSMAQSAYKNMLSTRRDQSLVFLGRSGSGKTSNFRHSLHYLALAAGSINKVMTVEKLNYIWTILENFGNCKTSMNQNATRFTQIFSLDFDQAGLIASASIQILLLERSRIGRRIESSDPTFHIMYRMLAGVEGTLRKELYLDSLSSSDGNIFVTPLQKHEDKQRAQSEFARVCAAFNGLGISEQEQKIIWSCLAAIYHLGNAGAVKAGTSNSRYQFGNPQSAQRAAQLLGTSVEELSRVIFGLASGGMVTPSAPRVPFRTPSPTDRGFEGSVVGLDALEGFLVGLYAEIFNCVAALINKQISTSTHTVSSILLVDTPGFQNPATCGRQTGATFEDLCHNYLQERLQLLFYHTTLVAPKDRYAQEHIEYNFDGEAEHENLINPAPMVSLLDKTAQNTMIRSSQTDINDADRRGFLWLLDEESMYPGSTDDSFMERLFTHYGDRDHQLLLRKAPGFNQFILQHLQGTNPVLYTANGWLKASRENPVARTAVTVLQESNKEDISKLFVAVRGLGPSSINMSGSVCGIEGAQSLRRASSIRRTFTAGTAAIKRKSICLQVKFTVDGLIETLRRTKLRFVHCFLPQHSAGMCESRTALLSVRSLGGQADDSLLNVPLIRSQLRGSEILEATRLYKQGFPENLPLSEFRRRFSLVAPTSVSPATEGTSNTGSETTSSGVLDERKAVEDMLMAVDIDHTSYRVGLSQIFFRPGTLAHLEAQRDSLLTGRVIHLQAHCRGFLARKRLQHRRLQETAVRCIQRNVRAFMTVRDWPWWRLLVRVTPLLNVHRTEEELKKKTEELENLRAKVEKLEAERTTLKHDNDKLEAKLSEMTADLAEEHSTATLAAERLDAETSERIRLERELSEVQNKNKTLQQQSERLEMELLYARSDINGVISEEDEDGESDHSIYKSKYERAVRELEFTRRRLQQQHEDDLEQLVGLKKQLEKKLSDAYEEVEEQRQVVGQWKRKVQKLTSEMNDLRLLIEEQNARNNLLEKKQRKFDSETQLLNDELRQERQQRERISREKDLILAEKYTLESNLADVRLELELKEERLNGLQQEYNDLTFGGKSEDEVATLRKQKQDAERRIHEQEEELDDLAGQVQMLEQAKVRLEMSLEQQRKEARREAQQRDDELEEVRCNAQKKVKALEAQLENEHEERTLLLREKHSLERRLAALTEAGRTEREGDEALLQRLKRDLRRTKALLRDAQTMLERSKADSPGKAVIRQLRNQLDDLECARAAAVKAKQSAESELVDVQSQLDEAHRQKADAEERANIANRERAELRTQLEENEEELAEVLKKYRSTVQQLSSEQLALQEQLSLVSELEAERNSLKEQLSELTTKLESMENLADPSSTAHAKRMELRAKELESKLEFEQTTRARLEVQIARLKETTDKLQTDLAQARTREQQAQDNLRKVQRTLRELREEHAALTARENESTQKRKELEKKLEASEAETAAARADLRLALQRIDDLQAAIQGELEDTPSDHSDSDNDSYSSDESIDTFLANHKISPTKLDRTALRLDTSPRLNENKVKAGTPEDSFA